MKTINSTLRTFFLVFLFSQIPQTFQEQVETKVAEAPDVEVPESKETSVDLGKLVSAKITSEQKTKFLPDGRFLDREITLHKSYSNAETAEISDLDTTVNPVLDEPSKTMEDEKTLLDAPGMSWTEASDKMSTNERPVENLRARGSYSSGGSSDDDDDDEEGEDDESSSVPVIVVVVAVCVVVALAVLVFAIWWCRKRRNAQQPRTVITREVPPGGPPKVPAARDANEEALVDDTNEKEGT